MPQRWICKTTGKAFLVNKDQKGLNPAVVEEFEAARNPQEKKKAEALLEPKPSSNPHLN